MKYCLLPLLLFSLPAHAKSPPACSHWPVTMALMSLKNSGITDPTQINEASTKTVLLAAQALPKGVFKEIYRITYTSNDGKKTFDVITSSESSYEECSISDVTTFLVSRKLD